MLVLDKVVIAVLVGMVIAATGYWFQTILDKHERKSALQTQLAQVQADRVAVVEGLQQRRDAILLSLARAEVRMARDLRTEDAAEPASRAYKLATRDATAAVQDVYALQRALHRLPSAAVSMRENRFWLGQCLYRTLAARQRYLDQVEQLTRKVIGPSGTVDANAPAAVFKQIK